MSLAEGVQGVISFKPYASGAITPNTEDMAPGATGAQVLRRVSSSLNLKRTSYKSNEIRQDRQIYDMRLGGKHVEGDIAGEFSPASYFAFFEAIHRDTRTAAVTASQADFTSVAATNSTSIFTLASGNPVTKGFQVGDLVRFTGNTASALDNVNYVITSFSGGSNETVHVFPAPSVDSSASTTFTMVTVGYSTSIPATGQVSRKFGIDVYHSDLDISRLFTEVRASKYALSLPAEGLATATFSFMGRDMETLSGGSAPYFTSPTAASATGIFAAVNGLLLLAGQSIGVVTGVTLQCDLSPTAATVVGQNFPAEIFLGEADVTGQLTAYLTDSSLFAAFAAETELQLILQLTTTSAANSPAVTMFLPRIKLTSSDLALQGESGQIITAPFQALRYVGSAAGVPNTTIRICDTEASSTP